MPEAQLVGWEGDEEGVWNPEETIAGGEANPKVVEGEVTRLPEGVGVVQKSIAKASEGTSSRIATVRLSKGNGARA